MELTFPDILFRRLESIANLSAADRRTVACLPLDVRDFPREQDIVREGDVPSTSFMVLDGFVYMYKLTGQGSRQIPALYIPGDMPDLHSTQLKVMDAGFRSLTPCKLGFVQHKDIHKVCETSYAITSGFWRMTLIDAAIFREWLTNVGQRTAYSRLAHLICEIFIRMRSVGLTKDVSCPWPFTQEQLADSIGVSKVHINRTLQELRGHGLLQLDGNELRILDWGRLCQEGDFDPLYLHLRDETIVPRCEEGIVPK